MKKLKVNPNSGLPVIDVPKQSVELERSEIKELAEETGMVKISNRYLRDMQQIGLEIESLGVVTVSDGVCFVTQQTLATFLADLGRKALEPGTDPDVMSKALSRLANAISNSVKSQKLPVEHQTKPLQATFHSGGFVPGQKIKVTQTYEVKS